MQRPSLRQTSLVLGLGFSLACSSPSREAEPEKSEATEKSADPSEDKSEEPEGPRGPTIGAPAPALALDSLSGQRVTLPPKPGEGSQRASVLIFGSFS